MDFILYAYHCIENTAQFLDTNTEIEGTGLHLQSGADVGVPNKHHLLDQV